MGAQVLVITDCVISVNLKALLWNEDAFIAVRSKQCVCFQLLYQKLGNLQSRQLVFPESVSCTAVLF